MQLPFEKSTSKTMYSLIVALIVLPASSLAAVSWTLTSTTLNQSSFEVQPYVSNGYISQRIPVEGFGYKQFTPINATAMDGTSGWPLFDPRFTAAMVAGFYDQQDNTTGTNFVRFCRRGDSMPVILTSITGANWWRATHFNVAHLVVAVPDNR